MAHWLGLWRNLLLQVASEVQIPNHHNHWHWPIVCLFFSPAGDLILRDLRDSLFLCSDQFCVSSSRDYLHCKQCITSFTWGPSAVLRPAGHYWFGWGEPAIDPTAGLWLRGGGNSTMAGRARDPADSLDATGPWRNMETEEAPQSPRSPSAAAGGGRAAAAGATAAAASGGCCSPNSAAASKKQPQPRQPIWHQACCITVAQCIYKMHA